MNGEVQMSQPPGPYVLGIFMLGVMAVTGGALAQSSASSSAEDASVWGFDMWCIEMEMLSPERCDERRPEDWEPYQAYVSRMERFEGQLREEERRQLEALEQLERRTRNPGSASP